MSMQEHYQPVSAIIILVVLLVFCLVFRPKKP